MLLVVFLVFFWVRGPSRNLVKMRRVWISVRARFYSGTGHYRYEPLRYSTRTRVEQFYLIWCITVYVIVHLYVTWTILRACGTTRSITKPVIWTSLSRLIFLIKAENVVLPLKGLHNYVFFFWFQKINRGWEIQHRKVSSISLAPIHVSHTLK